MASPAPLCDDVHVSTAVSPPWVICVRLPSEPALVAPTPRNCRPPLAWPAVAVTEVAPVSVTGQPDDAVPEGGVPATTFHCASVAAPMSAVAQIRPLDCWVCGTAAPVAALTR